MFVEGFGEAFSSFSCLVIQCCHNDEEMKSFGAQRIVVARVAREKRRCRKQWFANLSWQVASLADLSSLAFVDA